MIKLIKSFNYNNYYDYVKMFSSKEEQKQYFKSLNSIYVDDHNYIKLENYFNVNYDYDYLVNEGVNYIIFNNGYRDIYAFIIEKQYVRKDVTKIVYEVDVIQSFMFDFTLGNSYIERKKCTISELHDFDEGFNLGVHKIVSDTVAFNKGENYFAMFNGIRNYEVTADSEGKIIHYAEIPLNNDKPMTSIDGVNYPLFFMPLKNGNIPKQLADHPSLVGVIRFPDCQYSTTQIKIPYLLKTEDIGLGPAGYQTVDYLVDVATSITSSNKSGGGGSVAKNEVCDFYPYTYYVLTDGESEPLIMKPQELPSTISVVGKFALSHTPTERFYVEGFKGDTSGRTYNITNTSNMMLPSANSPGASFMSSNASVQKMNRENAVMGNIINGVATVAGAIATGGTSLIFGGVGSTVAGINHIKENDKRVENTLLTPNSIASFGTPSTRNKFGTNNVRILKYTVDNNVKNKVRNFTKRYGNKYNNYAEVNLKSYKGYIKFISPKIYSKIDNMYLNKIISILERGVYVE